MNDGRCAADCLNRPGPGRLTNESYMKNIKRIGGVAPHEIPAEWWSTINKTLGRPLARSERAAVTRAYKAYAGSVLASQIVAEIICPMVVSAAGKTLEIDLQSLAVADYQAGVPEDEVEYEVVMSSMLLKGRDLHHARNVEG